MTDHHDDLASAYLDGQLSPEDAARVENDPELLAEVDALAAVVERLQTEEAPVDAGARQRHLAAALAAFDQAAPTNVISLDGRGPASGPPDGAGPARSHPQPDDMARRTARVASATARDDVQARRLESRRRQGLPSWLSAAAALLVIGGGVAWFVGRQNQSTDTAAVTFSTDGAGATAAASDAALSGATDSGAPLSTAAPTEEATKSAVENAAGAASDGQAAVPAEASTAAAAAPASTAAVPPASTTATTRAVTTAAPVSSTAPTTADSGVLAFPSAPTGADVQARLAATGGSPQPTAGSSCGTGVTAPAGSTLVGYVPITAGGVPGEALFYRSGSGSGATTVLVVRTSSCQAFS